MRRIALALLAAFALASFGFVPNPAQAGDYRSYDDGYYGGDRYDRGYDNVSYDDGGYYSDAGYYDDGYNGRRYDDGYYRRHRHYSSRNRSVWYTSNCCYRQVVRHSRSVRYERTYRDYSYYRRPYRHAYYSDYYTRPYRYYSDRRPYYRSAYSGYYGWRYRARPYHDYGSAYLYRPYGDYAGYNTVGWGYGRCGLKPLADGRGGWVWSRRAGCF